MISYFVSLLNNSIQHHPVSVRIKASRFNSNAHKAIFTMLSSSNMFLWYIPGRATNVIGEYYTYKSALKTPNSKSNHVFEKYEISTKNKFKRGQLFLSQILYLDIKARRDKNPFNLFSLFLI